TQSSSKPRRRIEDEFENDDEDEGKVYGEEPAKLLTRLRLRLFPLGLADFLHFVLNVERPFLVADHDVRILLVAAIAGHDLRADAGVVVDQVRNEIHRLVLVADELEPVNHRWIRRISIAMRAVGPEPFSRHDILHAVAVHVDQINRMELRE